MKTFSLIPPLSVLFLVAVGSLLAADDPLAPIAGDVGQGAALGEAERHLEVLLKDVKQLGVPGVPGDLSVFGTGAFSVVTADVGGAEQRVPIVAAAEYGRGRMVAFAHDGFLAGDVEGQDNGTLLLNAIRWVAKQDKEQRRFRVGVRGHGNLKTWLGTIGAVQPLDGNDWTQRPRVDVVICDVSDLDARQVRQLSDFVKRGGGLLAGGLGWSWNGYKAQPGQTLPEDHPGNQLFGPAGIVWGGGTIKVPADKTLKVARPQLRTHARVAFEALMAPKQKRSKDVAGQLTATVTRALNQMPSGDELLRPAIAERLSEWLTDPPVPTAKQPIKLADTKQRLAVTLMTRQMQSLSPDEVTAHPAADVFPGSVPDDAERVAETLSIDTGVPDWHSTGLYAAPGEVVTVKVASSAVEGGLQVRIGCHKDTVWHKDRWERWPEITLAEPINQPVTQVANPFGGLVYVIVPKECRLGTVPVTVENCVRAPYFVLGKTAPDDWRAGIRNFPAPWAELATDKLIITVPSEDIRDLDFPGQLMTWWDRVMDAQADLRTIPRERLRPERMVMDEQISAGYLHAGYPIMGQYHHGKEAVDLPTLRTTGNWGFYHEIGHNHQRRDWTYAGMGEVTVNLFSLYCLDVVNDKAAVHQAITDEAIAKHIATFKKDGVKGNPFRELVPYVQMQREFGWEAYKQVFAEYEALPDGERAKSAQQRRDQWLVRMSKTVGRNLGPFFEFWKIKTTQAARQQVSDLPEWMPEGLE